ncbi:MAG: His-Xaa-Ser system radical SAM maturase HxsB [Elusimicrobia bacterium]|nr:MAG: His-Xaa-Ser system radical SAM maturase HxsB [Elusimicrobiota bacterium]KAF0157977.1 MAG: His-Xaa-Ser system radical SAM maturase HxsB [Elusimicrobiota bacterium]
MAKKPGANAAAPAAFQFRRLAAGGVLVTNDFGGRAFISDRDFLMYSSGRLPASGKAYDALAAGGFVRDRLDFETLAGKWRSRNDSVFYGTGLHIFVLTLRCNHKCAYCQSSVTGERAAGADMPLSVARKSVDLAFQSPRKAITIEFQGGEPLANWDVLREIVKYARTKEKRTGKKLTLAMVSNFSLMDEAKAAFLLENEVSLCTSLDGPESLHNKNRTWSGGNSHRETARWLKYFNSRHDSQHDLKYRVFRPGALLTVSRLTLGHAREVVDEYAARGLEEIFLRPLAPIGYAKKRWQEIGYSPEEFLEFYEKALRYILLKNRRGVKIREKFAQMLLTKILKSEDSGYLDMRCPCGAAIGQLAYNYNGDVYTCDEARMVGWSGDDIFKAGTVGDKYEDIIAAAATKTVCAASSLESQPFCHRCAYKPYCGVCPVVNYEAQNSLWGQMPSNHRCGTLKGLFDLLFGLLRDGDSRAVLETWVNAGAKR